MVTRLMNAKAGQVLLFKLSDVEEIRRVVLSLTKSGYYAFALLNNQKVIVDVISQFKTNPNFNAAQAMSQAEAEITSADSFNMTYTFFHMNKSQVKQALQHGSLQSYLLSQDAPINIRSVELQMIKSSDQLLLVLNFIAPKAALQDVEASANAEEF